MDMKGCALCPNLQNTGAQLLLCACTAFPSLPLGVLCVEHRLGAGSESCQPLELTGNCLLYTSDAADE